VSHFVAARPTVICRCGGRFAAAKVFAETLNADLAIADTLPKMSGYPPGQGQGQPHGQVPAHPPGHADYDDGYGAPQGGNTDSYYQDDQQYHAAGTQGPAYDARGQQAEGYYDESYVKCASESEPAFANMLSVATTTQIPTMRISRTAGTTTTRISTRTSTTITTMENLTMIRATIRAMIKAMIRLVMRTEVPVAGRKRTRKRSATSP